MISRIISAPTTFGTSYSPTSSCPLSSPPHRPASSVYPANGHHLSGIRFDDSDFQDGAVYDQWAAYGQSKTASILFSRSLAAKLESRGLKSYSLHPGVTFGTSLAPDFKEEDFVSLKEKDKVIGWDRDFDLKTLDECAATHVVAAFDTRLEAYNGVYLEDGNLSDDVQPTARGEGIEERLWELSEQLVGEKFSY